MKNYNYEQINEHIQWLINFMNEEYPNDFEIILDNSHAEIRSKLTTMNFLSEELKNNKTQEMGISFASFAEKLDSIFRC